MKKKFKTHFFALLLCLLTVQNPVLASNYYQPNAFIEAMRVMMEIFLSMGRGDGINPLGYGLPGNRQLNKQRWSPNVTPFNTADNPQLEGTWLSNNRFVLVIQNGYARIAIDQDEFQDFYVRYRPGVLQLRDGKSKRVVSFHMQQQNNRMALQDEQGRILIFKKVQ